MERYAKDFAFRHHTRRAKMRFDTHWRKGAFFDVTGRTFHDYEFNSCAFDNIENARFEDCSFINCGLFGIQITDCSFENCVLYAGSLMSSTIENTVMKNVHIGRMPLCRMQYLGGSITNMWVGYSDMSNVHIGGERDEEFSMSMTVQNTCVAGLAGFNLFSPETDIMFVGCDGIIKLPDLDVIVQRNASLSWCVHTPDVMSIPLDDYIAGLKARQLAAYTAGEDIAPDGMEYLEAVRLMDSVGDLFIGRGHHEPG